MSRLSTPAPQDTSPKAQRVLGAMEKALGFVPNMMRAMANAPAVLSGYANLSAALSGGVLPADLREKIGLLVAQENACDYCVSAHTAIAAGAGLSVEAILDARRGTAIDSAHQAALDFARVVLETQGRVSDDDLARVRAAGYGDAAIAEIIGNVVFTIYTNYFNNVAGTEIDFPRAPRVTDLAAV